VSSSGTFLENFGVTFSERDHQERSALSATNAKKGTEPAAEELTVQQNAVHTTSRTAHTPIDGQWEDRAPRKPMSISHPSLDWPMEHASKGTPINQSRTNLERKRQICGIRPTILFSTEPGRCLTSMAGIKRDEVVVC